LSNAAISRWATFVCERSLGPYFADDEQDPQAIRLPAHSAEQRDEVEDAVRSFAVAGIFQKLQRK
jgi:hypothetical protein